MDALAADRMDRMYRRQRHIYDLTRKYYLLGRDRLIERLAPPERGHVLEVGCGTGRNLLLASRRHPRAAFYGIDISAEMLESARCKIGAAPVRLAVGDATSFDATRLFGKTSFSRVFLSYSLSMIPNWPAAVEQSLACLEPGGELHIVDFGAQERLPGWFRTGLRRWLAAFDVVPRDGLEARLSTVPPGFALAAFERPFAGYAQYAVVRRAA